MATGHSPSADQWAVQGAALEKQGKVAEAVSAYLQSLQLEPGNATTLLELGNVLLRSGNCDDAMIAYQRAIALEPGFAEPWINLGVGLRAKNRGADAIMALRRAMALKPDHVDALMNLGICLAEAGVVDEAVGLLNRASTLQPRYARVILNLGYVRQYQGLLDEAIECYRRASELDPDLPAAHNLLWLIHFHPGYGPREIFEEHERWYLRSVRPNIQPPPTQDNDPSPARRLRIGYVSPDFCRHPVGLFMLPLMEHHDHSQFEIFCYTDLRAEDAVTSRIKSCADAWRATAALSDAQLAESVRADRIDILVDLTMHMKGSRLLAFARKPAPIQITYLAYCSTTGLPAMDYRFSDPHLDPLPIADCRLPNQEIGDRQSAIGNIYYSERTIRLRSYWCYPGPPESAELQPPPVRRNGYITFGCLNNYLKVSNKAFDLWCDLLLQVRDSRLILHSHQGGHRQRAYDRMSQRGVNPSRLQFNPSMPVEEYLKQYRQIDIALDPFPYGGGTTTCDALWMGVPVVSMRGETCVSRAGFSILSNVGCPHWVAENAQEYLSIAGSLAHDIPTLESQRLSLRRQLQASPLMDAPQFARDVESAYRQMWRRWCGSQGGN